MSVDLRQCAGQLTSFDPPPLLDPSLPGSPAGPRRRGVVRRLMKLAVVIASGGGRRFPVRHPGWGGPKARTDVAVVGNGRGGGRGPVLPHGRRASTTPSGCGRGQDEPPVSRRPELRGQRSGRFAPGRRGGRYRLHVSSSGPTGWRPHHHVGPGGLGGVINLGARGARRRRCPSSWRWTVRFNPRAARRGSDRGSRNRRHRVARLDQSPAVATGEGQRPDPPRVVLGPPSPPAGRQWTRR